MCILLSDSQALEEDGEKIDVHNVGEGEMKSRILTDNTPEHIVRLLETVSITVFGLI